jgi:hypothetical protein
MRAQLVVLEEVEDRKDDQVGDEGENSVAMEGGMMGEAVEATETEVVGKEVVATEAVGKEVVGKEVVATEAVGKEVVAKETMGKEVVAKEAVAKDGDMEAVAKVLAV